MSKTPTAGRAWTQCGQPRGGDLVVEGHYRIGISVRRGHEHVVERGELTARHVRRDPVRHAAEAAAADRTNQECHGIEHRGGCVVDL